MAINTTWSINDMRRVDADGGVIVVYWSMVAASDGAGGETASEGGQLRLTYDASSSDFIPYADLTEADVLGWVYNSLIEDDETANEAKARVEADRTAKVQGQIDRAASQANGIPWSQMDTLEAIQALGAIWPIALGFVGLVVVLARMHSDIETLKEKVRVLFDLWNNRNKDQR